MRNLDLIRPVWQEVYLDAIAHNMQSIRKHTHPNTIITAVVKANACSHGAVHVAPTVLQNGADRLAVAILEEAIELRLSGISERILVLGPSEPARASEVVQYNLDQAVFTFEQAKPLSDAAVLANKTIAIHIKVDSGMGRIGFLPIEQSLDEIERILNLPNLTFEGLFTHFSSADEENKDYSHMQIERYSYIKNALAQKGYLANLNHVCNSAGIIDLPQYHMDMVRCGIILYGTLPSDEVQKNILDLKPTMSLKARITNVKELEDHEAISYGRKYVTQGKRIIATLPIGYSDGYTRLLSNKAHVLVHGQRAPIVGNICMDQCMIDVTNIANVAIGDEVVLIGSQGKDAITPDELGALLGTISYEIFCMVGRRVPRIYYKNDDVIEQQSYLYDLDKH